MGENEEYYRERLTELNKTIDVEAVKKHVKKEFNKALDKATSVTDLVFLLYRNPCCGHQCGISDTLTGALPIDEDDYWCIVFAASEPVELNGGEE